MPEQEAHIDLTEILSAFSPVSLAEMDAVRLMNRIDTKYVTSEATLLRLLEDAAAAGYRVLETEGERIALYDSIYFDTPSLKMFYDHRNKRLVRQKVRTRCYRNSGVTFLEIKRKSNKGRTKKKRTALPESEWADFRGDAAAAAYLAAHSAYTAAELEPILETCFRRITLVNPEMTERMTIDSCLCFKNFRTGKEASLRDAVIIERKQDGRAASPMKGLLLHRRIHPLRVSKYCLAVTLTDPSVIPGRFKLKVRAIEKLINHQIPVL